MGPDDGAMPVSATAAPEVPDVPAAEELPELEALWDVVPLAAVPLATVPLAPPPVVEAELDDDELELEDVEVMLAFTDDVALDALEAVAVALVE